MCGRTPGANFFDSYYHMGVPKNSGTPKSSILIGFSIINHPFWGTPIFGNTHIWIQSPLFEYHVRQSGFEICRRHSSFGVRQDLHMYSLFWFQKEGGSMKVP